MREIGEVDHMFVNAETGELTHLVVNLGLLEDLVILPASKIDTVTEEEIHMDLDEDEMDQLPKYSPRDDSEIAAELREHLRAEDLPDDIEITVAGGIVSLKGDVSDVAEKRYLEYIARKVNGVIDVDNYLSLSIGKESMVISALADDPRTELAVIEVIENQGVVTLKGKVDSVEVMEAAEEIAAEQPGVIRVVNAMRVEEDDFTDLLKFRYAGFANRMRMQQ
jgi:osmotically-inducible protein OsmY